MMKLVPDDVLQEALDLLSTERVKIKSKRFRRIMTLTQRISQCAEAPAPQAKAAEGAPKLNGEDRVAPESKPIARRDAGHQPS